MNQTAFLEQQIVGPVRPKRDRVPAGLRVIRLLFRSLGVIAPGRAAAWAYRLWFTPNRAPRPAPELDLLAGADQHYAVEIRGKRVAVQTWGRGPAVLLVHGWSGRGAQLGAFIRPLLERGFRVITFDAPAHGFSEGKQTDLDEIRRAMLAIAAREGGLHALIAHSFGCLSAAFAAANGLAVSRLVFINAPCRTRDMLAIFRKELGISEKVGSLMQRLMQERFAFLGPDLWQCIDTDANVRKLTIPGLIIHDRDDSRVPYSQSELIAAAWPAADLKFTRGLGHNRVLTDQSVINAATAFVAV